MQYFLAGMAVADAVIVTAVDVAGDEQCREGKIWCERRDGERSHHARCVLVETAGLWGGGHAFSRVNAITDAHQFLQTLR